MLKLDKILWTSQMQLRKNSRLRTADEFIDKA